MKPSLDDALSRARRLGTSRIALRRPGMVRLWTFQPAIVWRELLTRGSLHVQPKLTNPEWRDTYDWMRRQMARRLPSSHGRYPWWAWVGVKPDLRSEYLRLPGGRGVRLELQLASHRVLVSDYETWHLVGCSYIARTPADQEEWDAAFDGTQPALSQLPEPWVSRVTASWELIFDLDALAAGGIWSANHLQGCFERLDLADVVEVTELAARH